VQLHINIIRCNGDPTESGVHMKIKQRASVLRVKDASEEIIKGISLLLSDCATVSPDKDRSGFTS